MSYDCLRIYSTRIVCTDIPHALRSLTQTLLALQTIPFMQISQTLKKRILTSQFFGLSKCCPISDQTTTILGLSPWALTALSPDQFKRGPAQLNNYLITHSLCTLLSHPHQPPQQLPLYQTHSTNPSHPINSSTPHPTKAPPRHHPANLKRKKLFSFIYFHRCIFIYLFPSTIRLYALYHIYLYMYNIYIIIIIKVYFRPNTEDSEGPYSLSTSHTTVEFCTAQSN